MDEILVAVQDVLLDGEMIRASVDDVGIAFRYVPAWTPFEAVSGLISFVQSSLFLTNKRLLVVERWKVKIDKKQEELRPGMIYSVPGILGLSDSVAAVHSGARQSRTRLFLPGGLFMVIEVSESAAAVHPRELSRFLNEAFGVLGSRSLEDGSLAAIQEHERRRND
ncbi:MAG: hypothetical protein NT169_28800 [Chloroflexi bacterium]|nr:hypothetical protein [Chloroflexota bacterium]